MRSALFMLLMVRAATSAQVQELRPFSLPWDGTSPAAAALAPTAAAGASGPVTVGADGHIYTGSERLRLFGVNFSFGAAFPDPEYAPIIADRLAGFGFNCVRFHHMDMSRFPDGIRDRNSDSTRRLDPTALARLDFLINELRKHGIYTNLNLLVSRPFNAEDGLPQEIEELSWKERHVVGFFHPRMIELQKEYAEQLLTHVNPYSGLAYCDDPAVAMVEINNENGLIHAWLSGTVDELPTLFRDELQVLWNQFLTERYGDSSGLQEAWQIDQTAPGAELLENGDFQQGTQSWNLEQHAGAAAVAGRSNNGPGGQPALRIRTVTPGTEGWHVQFNQGGLPLDAQQAYTLEFSARSKDGRDCTVQIGQAHAPWSLLGFSARIHPGPDWQDYRFVFRLDQGDANARLNFTGLGTAAGEFELAGISLRPGGTIGLLPGEDLAAGSIGLFELDQQGLRTNPARLDFIAFLYGVEEAYWQRMTRFLKDDLEVKGLVLGTIAGCAPVTQMAQLDAVDTHAYWQHPRFPGEAWDSENWLVDNLSMVETAGGVLNNLAHRRVHGKPHFCTEYNHPAPNTFSSEAPLLLSAFAAFQDWDGIFIYSYKHGSTGWDRAYVESFFDVHAHATKMVQMPIAAALFRRGDLSPARHAFAAAMTNQQELSLLRDRARAWSLVDASTLGVPDGFGLLHRIGLQLEHVEQQIAAPFPGDFAPPQNGVWLSDTGQMGWYLSRPGRQHVRIDTPKTKAVIGFTGGERVRLGTVTVKTGATYQNWNSVALTLLEGENWSGPATILVTATAYQQNTGMGWTDAQMNSVGRNWGHAPVLIEPVPLEIELPAEARRVNGRTIDPAGNPRTLLPVEPVEGEPARARLLAAPESGTLWYIIRIRPPAAAADLWDLH